MAHDRLRVVVVSVDPLARAGLAARLAGDEGLEIVTTPPGSEDAQAEGLPPDVVAWDIGLDRAAAGLRLPLADVPTVALIAEVEQAAPAVAAGAHGVVFRDAPPPRLAEALRAVALGLVVLDEGPASAVLRPAASGEGPGMAEPLTARERDVLALLGEGLSNRLIAERLGISEHTAKFHVNAILGKLGAESRTEALVLAARLGLVTL